MKRAQKTKQPSPNIRVHGPLLKAVKRAAEQDGRKVNAMVLRLIEKGLAT